MMIDVALLISLCLPSISVIWMGGRVLSRLEIRLEVLSVKIEHLSERLEELEGFDRRTKK